MRGGILSCKIDVGLYDTGTAPCRDIELICFYSVQFEVTQLFAQLLEVFQLVAEGTRARNPLHRHQKLLNLCGCYQFPLVAKLWMVTEACHLRYPIKVAEISIGL